MTRTASILLAVACAACKGGGEPDRPAVEPATEPALTGFYRIVAADTGDGMRPADELFRSSIDDPSPDAPQFVWHRLGVGFEGDSLRVQSSTVIHGRDEAYPYASCTASAVVSVVWHGASFEVTHPVVAESRFSVFDGAGQSIADTCKVSIPAGRIAVERTDDRIELVADGARLLLVPDDPDPKPETHVPRAVE